VILEKDGQGYQQVQEPGKWHLTIVNNIDFKNDTAGLEKYIYDSIHGPFNLSKDHMMRAELLRLDETEHILVVTIHHIASDGWSAAIIVKELNGVVRSVCARP
jgi:hypothetical protein